MARGGKRPGAGRKKGSKAKPRAAEFEREVAKAIAQTSPAPPLPGAPLAQARAPLRRQAVDIMSEVMTFFMGLAARHQPATEARPNQNADPKLFERYLKLAGDVAARLAPYQTPALAALKVTEDAIDPSLLDDEDLRELERIQQKAAAAAAQRNPGGAGSTQH